ncbi:MAG: hypothetical protein ACF8GE_11790 [Phycisphaerales bacterium JB043]
MDDTRSNPNIPDELPIGALLRMCADGETLTPEQQARVDAYCAEHAGQPCCMKFEQTLRDRVAGVLSGSQQAPQSLRDAVRGIAEQQGEVETAPAPIVRADRSFWRPSRVMPLLAAAAVLLFLGGTLVWQSASLFGTSMPSWIETTQQASLVGFLDSEHARVSENIDVASRKLTADTPVETVALVNTNLGKNPCQLNLLESCQLRLVGAGDCGVPGRGKSIHVMYQNTATNEMLSVFIQQDPRSTESDPAHLCASRLSEGNEVLAWRYNGLIYYVVSPNPDQASEVMAAFGAPDARSNL